MGLRVLWDLILWDSENDDAADGDAYAELGGKPNPAAWKDRVDLLPT